MDKYYIIILVKDFDKMHNVYNPQEQFDIKLASKCARSFSESTGLGCTVSDIKGQVLYQRGYGYPSCTLCVASRKDKGKCSNAHNYGMAEAERFGGMYIYFCPMGLTFFVSPIMGKDSGMAKITVGPFLMVDHEEFIDLELKDILGLDNKLLLWAREILNQIPYVAPKKVNSMAELLFMSVGFMNNVSFSNRMLETQDTNKIQGEISNYIYQIKTGSEPSAYPFKTEQALLQNIKDCDKTQAQKNLNEILGSIFFGSGGDFSLIKSRVAELLILISRSAVRGGADPDFSFRLNHKYLQEIQLIKNIDELCFWLTRVMNQFIDSVFKFVDIKNIDVIYKSVQFIRNNYSRKISLDEVAANVYLSPSYFSKVFKKEMNCTFNSYLNNFRIDKSKELLLNHNIRLVEISSIVGFEDQSYFTKVFKRIVGISPKRFRESGGRVESNFNV